jgi:hypothetical protein
MKKILLKLIPVLYLFVLQANAQTSPIRPTQGTIKVGSQGNSFIMAIKPSGTFTGRLSSFQFSFAIPVSVGARPVMQMINNFNPNISYALDTNKTSMVNGVMSYVYDVVGDGAQSAAADRTYTVGVDNNMAEVALTGGIPVNTTVTLCHLPNGGTSGLTYFYLANQGVDFTDEFFMFYGTGALNDGSGYSGTSIKPLSAIGLPLTWLNFTAVKQDKNALLNWAVQETNNNHFEIERSVNGVDFVQIGSNVASKGAGSNNYSITDAELINLKSNVVYYRIKQVDNDGKFTYSKVATIKLSTDKNYNIGIYPNPVNDNTTLTIDVAKATRAQVKVIDAAGKTVQTISLVLNAGVNQRKINFSTLANGSYNVNVMSEDGLQETLKVVKQ